jgi:hypothetical protein
MAEVLGDSGSYEDGYLHLIYDHGSTAKSLKLKPKTQRSISMPSVSSSNKYKMLRRIECGLPRGYGRASVEQGPWAT